MDWVNKYLDSYISLDDMLDLQNNGDVTLNDISTIISRIIKKSGSLEMLVDLEQNFKSLIGILKSARDIRSVVIYFFDEKSNIFQKETAKEEGYGLPDSLRINRPLISRMLVSKSVEFSTSKDTPDFGIETDCTLAGSVIDLKGKVFGLVLLKTGTDELNHDSVKNLLYHGAKSIAHALNSLLDKFQERTKSYLFQAFFEINELISLHLDKSRIYDLLCNLFINIFECNRVIFASFDLKNKKVKIERISGIEDSLSEGQIIGGFSNIQLAVIGNKTPIYIEDMQNDLAYGNRFLTDNIEQNNLKSLIIAPIITKGHVIGSFQLEYIKEGMIKDNHLVLLRRLSNIIGNVIEKVHLYKKMEEMATTDFLTGLLLKREFVKIANNEISRSLRNRQPLSLLFIDVDKFKNFNDTYGHLIGDDVLKIVSKVIQNSIRDIDIASRYAGDEFCVLLINNNSQQALVSAERIRKNVSNVPLNCNNEKLYVTLSIGVSTLSDEPKEFEELMHEADAAMYSGKRNGSRNVATVFSSDIKL